MLTAPIHIRHMKRVDQSTLIIIRSLQQLKNKLELSFILDDFI
jgi:hypothetical protein